MTTRKLDNSKTGRSWSIRLAVLICSIYCCVKCKTRWCVFFMAQTACALMSNSRGWKSSSSRTEWFINARGDTTMISPCHAPCCLGRTTSASAKLVSPLEPRARRVRRPPPSVRMDVILAGRSELGQAGLAGARPEFTCSDSRGSCALLL